MSGVAGTSVKSSVFWSMLERFGSVGVQFILQLVLARILVPEDYGVCAILLVFVNIFTLLVDSGLPMALVQQKKFSQKDYSSVFYAVSLMSVVAYGVIYVSAPFCARAFNDEIISPTLRVISLSLIFGAVNSVQVAYVKSKMLFRVQFFASIIAVVLSAVVSIYMAYNGYGIWAIVYQYLISRAVITILLCFMLPWRPTKEFSLERLKRLFSYGWKLMVSNFISVIVTDVYTLVIGKFYTKDQLGVYDTGSRIPTTISNSLTVSIGAVLFPVFSRHQDEPDVLRRSLKKYNIVSLFLIFPFMICLAAAAEPVVMLLLTEKWSAAVLYMQIACVMYAFYPIHVNNLNVINAVGRSDVALKLEIIKKLIDLSFLFVFIHIGLEWVAIGRLMTSLIGLIINLKPTESLIGYTLKDQLKDILPIIIISTITGGMVFMIGKIMTCAYIFVVITQVVTALIAYFGLSLIFNRKSIDLLKSIKNEKSTDAL